MTDSTYSIHGPECPYCGHTQQPDDPGFYNDNYDTDECPKCEKSYSVSVYHSTSWTCEPINEALAALPQGEETP